MNNEKKFKHLDESLKLLCAKKIKYVMTEVVGEMFVFEIDSTFMLYTFLCIESICTHAYF